MENINISLSWSEHWQAWIVIDNCRKLGKLEQMFDSKKKAEYVYFHLLKYYQNHPESEW